MELMYRQPGRKEHQSLPDVLDEIIKRLDKIESQINQQDKKSLWR
jgi:hypothetical protein